MGIQIFISYADKDRWFAKRLASDLGNFLHGSPLLPLFGYTVGDNLDPQLEEWPYYIVAGIAILSPDYFMSDYGVKQLQRARQEKMPIFPIYLRDVKRGNWPVHIPTTYDDFYEWVNEGIYRAEIRRLGWQINRAYRMAHGFDTEIDSMFYTENNSPPNGVYEIMKERLKGGENWDKFDEEHITGYQEEFDEKEILIEELFRNLSPDKQEQVLARLQQTQNGLTPETIEAINATIQEIQASPTGMRLGTNFETALNLFVKRGPNGVGTEDLQSLVSNAKNRDKEASKIITRLRPKLEEHQHTIVRDCVYRVVPAKITNRK